MSNAQSSRTRFGNVMNAEAMTSERWERGDRYGCDSREAAVELKAVDLGYCIVSLDAGRRSCPYHFHHSEEEVFYVLSGHAQLRQGDAEGEELIELGPGDFVSFPAGTGIAHQFLNNSDGPFVYLAMSNRIKSDVAEYPDSNKVNIRGTPLTLRREPILDYFDGEE